MAKKSNKLKKTPKLKVSFKTILISIMVIIVSILYSPAAILFFIGMMPTIAAYLTDKRPGRNKTFTIGAINFSGCFYYLIKILSNSYPMEVAMDYLSNPMTIVVIYTAAGLGYIIDYITTVTVASILRQKSLIRLEKLEEKKKDFEERWGNKVNGNRPLGGDGFLAENPESEV